MSFPRASSKSDLVIIKGAKECVDGAITRIYEILSDLVSNCFYITQQLSCIFCQNLCKQCH